VKAIGVFAVWVGSWFAANSLCVLCTDPPSGRLVALPADLVVSQGITVTPKETVGSGSVIYRTRGLASSPHLSAQDVEDVLSQRRNTRCGHQGMDR
jgi:hypothetical protein